MFRENCFNIVVLDLQKNGLIVLILWFHICRILAYFSTKLLLEKSAKTKKKLNTKNHKSVKKKWRILLQNQYFQWIFETTFSKQFPLKKSSLVFYLKLKHFFYVFLFSTLSSKLSRKMCKLRHKLRNAKNWVALRFTWQN